jgi:anti-sigma regulatory factor (Ser/Thr protein kinase)
MESITFTIANELAAIPVIQAAAAVYVRTAGADDIVVHQTELVIEEIVTNIIQYEYLPGQRETIALTLLMQEGVLELLICFQGIPFDVDYLRRCEKTSLSEIINSGGHGMGLRLLGQFSDDIQYRNLGLKGQEICIRRFVRGTGRAASQREEDRREEAAPATPLQIGIRRMHSDEAVAISKLAYFAYKYTYVKEELYDPEEVRRRNEDGRMISYVAVNERDNSIIGHMAMIPDNLSEMPELAAAFVNPRYRRSGSLNALTDYMILEVQKQGWQGTFGTAVTSHPYSQTAAARMGMREAALFVSRVEPLAFQAITDQAVCRESFLYMVRLFDPSPRKSYYPPPHHRKIIEKIGRNINITVVFADITGEIPHTALGETETRTDAYGAGHIVLHRWGSDSLSQVQAILRRWCLDRLETIYLYLPLPQPSTATLCYAIEEMGFFFSGLTPGRAGEDWLVLQYLNNQRYDYGLVKSATAFGQELIDYVRAFDPTAAIGNKKG